VLTGSPDLGATFEVFRRDKFTGDLLIGHATYGGALGYQVAQAGNLMVSIFAGASHPYAGVLTTGWSPVVGVKVRF
jgi:hypothetical protein